MGLMSLLFGESEVKKIKPEWKKKGTEPVFFMTPITGLTNPQQLDLYHLTAPSDPPHPSSLVPPDTPEMIKSFVARFMNEVQQQIVNEAVRLRELGLAVPKQLTPLTFTLHGTKYSSGAKYFNVTYVPPVFDPAPKPLLLLLSKSLETIHAEALDRVKLPSEYCFKFEASDREFVIYCVSKDVDEALKTFKQEGAASVVEKYPGRWVNRDPYRLYKMFSEGAALLPTDKDNSNYAKIPDWSISPLRAIKGFTPDQIRHRDLYLAYLNNLVEGKRTIYEEIFKEKDWHKRLYLEYPPDFSTSYFLEDIPPIPTILYPPETVTVKILPNNETKPALCEQFFESLRIVKNALTFGLYSTNDAQFLYLTCAPEDLSVIKQSAQTLLPDFMLEECHPLPPAQHSLHATPQSFSNKFKVSADFAVDPYCTLFNALVNNPTLQPFQFELTFIPAPIQLISHLYTKGGQAYEGQIGTKDKLMDRKNSPWMLRLRFSGNDPVSLKQTAETFLCQYEVENSTWNINTGERTSAIPWGLLSNRELVAFAHFPKKDAHHNQLERSGSPSGWPPPLYLKPE